MKVSHRHLLLGTAVALAAGCAATGIDGPASANLSAARQTHQAAAESPAAMAGRLLSVARVPADADRSTSSPTRVLDRPPERPTVDGLVVRSRWWRVHLPFAQAYAWISHHQPAALSSIGSSASSGPHEGDRERDADFAPPALPATVNSAELSIAVAPLSATVSAIGVYAVVVRQPARLRAEDVPTSVDRVTVITRRTVGEPDAGQILGRKTLTGTAARRLVLDFDALRVQPPGEQFSCPAFFVTQTALFTVGTHHWSATTGRCIGVDVTLDGRPLPVLDAGAHFSRDMRAAYGRPFPTILVPQPVHAAQLPAAGPDD